MRYLAAIVGSSCLLAAGGCDSVTCKRPLGDAPARIEASEWEGDWATDDGWMKVIVKDPNNGLLTIAWLDTDKQGNPEMKTMEVELRASGDRLFANTKGEEATKGGGYWWGRIRKGDRRIVVWGPDVKAFRRLVEEGVFPGTLDGDDVRLGDLTADQQRIIISGERGVLFDWEDPGVFLRIAP